jgi:hypothetical protein
VKGKWLRVKHHVQPRGAKPRSIKFGKDTVSEFQWEEHENSGGNHLLRRAKQAPVRSAR